jgi:hypothetical protein
MVKEKEAFLKRGRDPRREIRGMRILMTAILDLEKASGFFLKSNR